MRHIMVTIPLLLCSLACTSGDSGSDKVRPPGESSAAPAPDTALNAPPPPAAKKPARRAWDTAAPESFDVQELNRKRAEPEPQKIDTMRVIPTEYPGLPVNIAAWLEERGYTIPQCYVPENGKHSNVIFGDFKEEDQQDCAVLVTDSNRMKLIVFPSSLLSSVEVIVDEEIEPYYWRILPVRNNVSLFSYKIQSVGQEYIKTHYEALGGPEPPEINHKAINLYLVEIASTVYYYKDGIWLQLQGAD